jgi:hypothetical protein
MQAHDHAPSAHDAHAAHAPAAADPDWDWWLGGTVLFLVVLGAVFLLPATHAAGPATPERPLAPEPGDAGFAAHVSAVEAQRSGPIPSTPQDADRDRLAALYGALAGGGSESDDSVDPSVNADIAWLIRTVADSGFSYTRDGEPHGAIDTAEFMLERWEKSAEPVYSGESFIRKVAGHTLADQKLNRVKFANGSDRPLSLWLQEQLTSHQAGK